MRVFLILGMALISGCVGLPDNVRPVENFSLQRYLGTWYEIARLDHSFEEGLEQVSAQYTLREDGGVQVLNRGYDPKSGEWSEAKGKAYFVETEDRGYLKVSFFGPFYGSYIVFELDQVDYQYAFVSGPDKDYLWLLARTPTISEPLADQFKTSARRRGFDLDELIWVKQQVQP